MPEKKNHWRVSGVMGTRSDAGRGKLLIKERRQKRGEWIKLATEGCATAFDYLGTGATVIPGRSKEQKALGENRKARGG